MAKLRFGLGHFLSLKSKPSKRVPKNSTPSPSSELVPTQPPPLSPSFRSSVCRLQETENGKVDSSHSINPSVKNQKGKTPVIVIAPASEMLDVTVIPKQNPVIYAFEKERSDAACVYIEGLRQGTCVTCMEEVGLITLSCGDGFCEECLCAYVETRLSDGRTDIKCMQCPEEMQQKDLAHVWTRNPSLHHRHDHFSLLNHLTSDPSCRFCPTPNCPFAVFISPDSTCPHILCPVCAAVFCVLCRDYSHPGAACSDRKAELGLSTLSSSTQPESAELKPCPSCNVFVQKSGGCNAILCRCGHEFCWLCLQPCNEALHYLPHTRCRMFDVAPPLESKTRYKRYGIMLAGFPFALPVAAALGAGAGLYVVEETLKQKIRENPTQKTKITAGAVVGAPIAVPLIAGVGCVAGIIGFSAYVVSFPFLMMAEEKTDLLSVMTDRISRMGGGSK